MTLEEKYNLLRESLKSLGKVVVAYSGGVDSTFLLKTAVDTLGAENVLACIGISSSLAKSQHTRAIERAETIGAKIEEVKLREIYDSEYSANNPDRCFHCKTHLYSVLEEIAGQNDFSVVICGSNFDDMDDFRPGNKAADIQNIRSPLAEVKMTKNDIREMSRKLNLSTADIPASPCLASRIAYGLEITEQRLKQIEEAEDFLRTLGLTEFRVRHHDTIARIEVKPEDIEKVTTKRNRRIITDKFKSLGFKYVTLDLQGFRSGSLNESLSENQKKGGF
ncbi:MAG: ATP-dependent sacrificial sulfur transferase LarE [Sedimentisphaerales bacterium]|nr:ATP-dependent sacrificial sulfur transferase LarE [Sedimentisphaerales bacterium]